MRLVFALGASRADWVSWRKEMAVEDLGEVLAVDETEAELLATDTIYSFGADLAPIVLEQHSLIFFTTPKVACTTFKQLFRRMRGLRDWRIANHTMPHDPVTNGLTYLFNFSLDEAQEMMRDKRSRILLTQKLG